MIIDINNYIGKRKYKPERTVSELLREMDEAGVDMAVVSSFTEIPDNDYVLHAVNRYPDRLTGMCVINPWKEDAVQELENAFRSKAFRALRLDPLRHGFNADNIPLLSPLLSVCARYSAPVWVYGTADVFSAPVLIKELAEAFPSVPVIIGMMGFNYDAGTAVSIAYRVPNIYLDQSGAMHQNLVRAKNAAGPAKILLGSGTPDISYFTLEIEKLKSIFTDPEDIDMVLGGNAAKLFNILL